MKQLDKRLKEVVSNIVYYLTFSTVTDSAKFTLQMHSATTYMNEHGVTKEEANRELEKMNGDMNKIVNE